MSNEMSKNFSESIIPNLENYKTIFPPEGRGKGNWVGAPSVIKMPGDQVWMAYRTRTPDKRGYKVTIAKSTDCFSFTSVFTIYAEELGVDSLERPALIRDPVTGKFKLYLSVDRPYYGWQIVKLDDVEKPEDFSPATSQVVIRPSAEGSDSRAVKDPFVFTLGYQYFMTYIGWDEIGEQAFLAFSPDGRNWKKSDSNPVLKRSNWHDGLTRIACVLPRQRCFDVYYEGTGSDEFFNIRTGLAQSVRLSTWRDLSPKGPLLASPTPGDLETVRYLDYSIVEGSIYFFYSAANEDGSFELRVTEEKDTR